MRKLLRVGASQCTNAARERRVPLEATPCCSTLDASQSVSAMMSRCQHRRTELYRSKNQNRTCFLHKITNTLTLCHVMKYIWNKKWLAAMSPSNSDRSLDRSERRIIMIERVYASPRRSVVRRRIMAVVSHSPCSPSSRSPRPRECPPRSPPGCASSAAVGASPRRLNGPRDRVSPVPRR